jgi:hypothetical protein
MRRLAGETGQSYVEWLGGTALMVIVVLAIFATNPGLGHELRCQTSAQIDRIMSIDQTGSCHSPKPKPDQSKQRRDAQNRADRKATRSASR